MKYGYRFKQSGVWLCKREDWQYREWIRNNNRISDLPVEVQDWYYEKRPIGEYPFIHLKYIKHLPMGIVDCITYGSLMAYAFDDYEVLEVHVDLLQDGIRWPIELTPPGNPKMRSINSLTRDPFISHWWASYMMNRKELIAITPVPWWLRRRYVNAWFRYVTDEAAGKVPREKDWKRFNKYLRKLICWGEYTDWIREALLRSKVKLVRQLHHRFGISMYSLHLWALMAHILGDSETNRMIACNTPEWNTFIWLLVMPGLVDPEEIDGYVPQRMYNWGSNEDHTHIPLEANDPYPLDKQLLIKLTKQT